LYPFLATFSALAHRSGREREKRRKRKKGRGKKRR